MTKLLNWAFGLIIIGIIVPFLGLGALVGWSLFLKAVEYAFG